MASELLGLPELVVQPEPLVLPGAFNAMTARLIEQVGFKGVYLSGAGITNALLGMADLGLLTATELIAQTAAVVESVQIPVVVDADTGFGGPLNVARTVRDLERAGAAAITIEDQTHPKKCGHFDDKSVVPPAEMVTRIVAAVDARRDPRMMIIARTDARAVNGFQDAVDRARLYKEVGADMTFIEAPQTVEELNMIPRLVPGPQLLNVVEGGKTPIPTYADVQRAGYAVVLYANSALRAALKGMRRILEALRAEGSTAHALDLMATWEERQNLVGRDELEDQADRFRNFATQLVMARTDTVAAEREA